MVVILARRSRRGSSGGPMRQRRTQREKHRRPRSRKTSSVQMGRGISTFGGSGSVCYSQCRSRNGRNGVAVEMLRRLTMLAIPIAAGVIVACAARPTPAVKYPPRKAGCGNSASITPTCPRCRTGTTWARSRVLCHIDDTEKKPALTGCIAEGLPHGRRHHLPSASQTPRPKERGARISRPGCAPETDAEVADAGAPEVDPTLPPPASPEESAGPVVPPHGPRFAPGWCR